MSNIVSVIIPVYNAEKTIEKCLNSLINQKYKELEIILINDGSTDKSKEICERYEKNNTNIKLINKINGGPGKAREEGLKYANGKYISFIDADDYIDLNFYSILIKKMEKKEANIIQCGYKTVDINGKCIEESRLKKGQAIGKYNNAKAYVYQKNTNNFLWNKIFEKQLFKNVEFKPLFAGEDACVLTQLYSNADKVLTIPDKLYYYVQTSDSLCRGKYSLKKLDSVKAGEFMYNYQKKKFPDLADYYKLYICSNAGQCYCNLKFTDIEQKEIYMQEMKEAFNKYFTITNPKLFKVSAKRFIFILMFKISPELCTIYYKRRINIENRNNNIS